MELVTVIVDRTTEGRSVRIGLGANGAVLSDVNGRVAPTGHFVRENDSYPWFDDTHGATIPGITLAERAAIHAARSDWKQAQVQRTLEAVESEMTPTAEYRRSLTSQIAYLRDQQEAEFERLDAREDARAWDARYQHEDALAVLRAQIARFDERYPEIVAEMFPAPRPLSIDEQWG